MGRRSVQVQSRDICVLCDTEVILQGTLDERILHYKSGLFLCDKCSTPFPTHFLNKLRKKYVNMTYTRDDIILTLKTGEMAVWEQESNWRTFKTYKKICEDCGEPFKAYSEHGKWCFVCADKRREIETKKIKKALKTILKRGNEQAKILYEETKNKCLLTCQPTRLLMYYASERLSIARRVYEHAEKILYRFSQESCWLGSRYSLAAGILYVSCIRMGERRTQRDIAREFLITSNTVAKSYKKVKEALNLEVLV